jgi:hypothetical protein
MKCPFHVRLYNGVAWTLTQLLGKQRRQTMPMQWIMLWERSIATAARPKRDAFADPLEGAEWTGFRWEIPLIERLMRQRQAQPAEHHNSRALPQPLWRPF